MRHIRGFFGDDRPLCKGEVGAGDWLSQSFRNDGKDCESCRLALKAKRQWWKEAAEAFDQALANTGLSFG